MVRFFAVTVAVALCAPMSGCSGTVEGQGDAESPAADSAGQDGGASDGAGGGSVDGVEPEEAGGSGGSGDGGGAVEDTKPSEDAEPSGRACADVHEPTPGPERPFRQLERGRDRLAYLADRLGHQPILGVNEVDDTQGVELADPLRTRVALFGEAAIGHRRL